MNLKNIWKNTPASRTQVLAVAGSLFALACVSVAQAQEQNNKVLRAIQREQTSFNRTQKQKGVKWAQSHNFPTSFTNARGEFFEIAGVSKRGTPILRKTFGLEDAKTTGASHLWPGGSAGLSLTGTGLFIGLWEAGGNPDLNHQEYIGRATTKDGDPTVTDHATHVAGILSATGVNPQAKGMAFQTTLHCYNADNDSGETPGEAVIGMQLSNHSYGFVNGWVFGALGDDKWVWLGDRSKSEIEDDGFGVYNDYTVVWDQITYNAPFYLPCVSAGNSRNPGVPSGAFEHWARNPQSGNFELVTAQRDDQSTYDNIGFGLQIAKNTLTVCAAEKLANGIYNDPSDVVMSSFSSWGPADDGRIKPEISGDGVDVLSSVPNNGYARFSGTSMAGPNVCGSLALLQQHYKEVSGGARMRASTMKALALQTAREAGDAPGPDYAYGYGLLNVVDAATLITQTSFNPYAIQELQLSTGETKQIPINIGQGDLFKVTLCWTDPAGTVTNAYDSRTPVLVNDLDVRVRNIATGEVFEPWVLDVENPAAPATTGDNVLDPVEQIVIDAPAAGDYMIEVSHKGATLKPAGKQNFSLVVTAPIPDGFAAFSIDPGQVVGGVENAIATLVLAETPTEDTVVNLRSLNPNAASVPTTITVPAGVDKVDIPVITKSVRPKAGNAFVEATIFASAPGIGSRSVKLKLFPIGVAGYTLDADTTVGGNTVGGTVSLSNPAATGGALISLTSDGAGTARTTRNWVLIQAGQISGKVKIKTNPVFDGTNVTLHALRLGSDVPADLYVTPVSLSGFTASPSSLFSNQTVKFTVSLDGLAPTGGSKVEIVSSNPSVLSVPSSVVVPAGKRTFSFNATASRVTSTQNISVRASRKDIEKNIPITVSP